MLFTEAELYKSNTDFESILSEAVYLNEQESLIKPKAITVVENARLGVPIVGFRDVEKMSSDYGITYSDAIQKIAEANEVEASKLAVAVDEAEIILDPSLINKLDNVVVKPVSESDVIFKYTGVAIDHSEDAQDLTEQLMYIVEAGRGKKKEEGKAPSGEGVDPKTIDNAIEEAKKSNKPGVISRIIGSLRRWAEKVRVKYEMTDGSQRGIWLKLKNKIAQAIVFLTKKLQSDEKYAQYTEYKDKQEADKKAKA